MLAKFNPVFYGNKNKLTFTTTCGPDDQFSSPKQIRWSAALGKLLVVDASNNRTIIRNFDLSSYSKFTVGAANHVAIDADHSSIFQCTSYLRKLNPTTYTTVGTPLLISFIRMIDASGDPDYVYVTSNNATDGHGVRKVRKSDMTVVASLLATGSGDGQFNNPLGIKYYGGYVYVCDVSNSRIVKLNALDLSFIANFDVSGTLGAVNDIDTDGINWYCATSVGRIRKCNMSFNSIAYTGLINTYSICIIPDQGDGNGQTLAIIDNTNSHIARYKCSDLSQVGSDVGSSGDGSSSLFDPTFTTSKDTTITYMMDDGFTYTTASGTSHALSWNGFAGYTWRTAGPHRCTVRVAGGLGLVTGIDARTDGLTSLKNLKRTALASFIVSSNSGYTTPLSDLPGSVTYIVAFSNPVMPGSICDVPPLATTINLGDCLLSGALSDLRSNHTYLVLNSIPGITGSVSDLKNTLQTCYLYGATGILPGSIAHLVNIRDIRIYSMGWDQAGVDTVIDSIYTARANYTYSTGPSLQIGGTNAAPSGSYTDPTVTPGDGNSNSDWSWNGTYHVPLTGKAKIYYLVNGPDHGTDTFYHWAITYTS